MLNKKKTLLKLTLLFISICIIIGITNRVLSYYRRIQDFDTLSLTIRNIAISEDLDYSFLLKQLDFPRLVLSCKKDEKFPAASLIKLPVLAAAFAKVNEKKISLTDKIVITKKDITGGSGKLKAYKLPHSTSFEELLEFMISYSDNTATNKIINILGFEWINQVSSKLGLENTNLSRYLMDFTQRRKGIENYTSASDMAIILEHIYNKELVNKNFSEIALEFLKNQTVNDRIPRYLPDKVSIAHKTGLERDAVHDVGIVFTSKGDYILCVLVKGFKNYQQAKNFIAQISLLTYNLLQ